MSYLYALQMFIPNYPFRPVKIGFSLCPQDRTRAFSGGPFPVLCLGWWPAVRGQQDEAEAHSRFRDYRLYGEWFYPSREVATFLEEKLGKPLSELQLTITAKALRFDARFREMFEQRREFYRAPDPYEYPFSLPYEKRLEAVMAELAKRWPTRGGTKPEDQYITTDDLLKVTGLSRIEVALKIPCFQVGNIVRYKLRHVREFLSNHPQYLETITA